MFSSLYSSTELFYIFLLLLSMLFFAVILFRYHAKTLNVIILVATISNSFILFGKYSAFDEVLVSFILFVFIVLMIFKKLNYRSSSLSFFNLESILLVYLLSNTLISFFLTDQLNFSNLRFINIYIVLLIIIFISSNFVNFNDQSIALFKIGALFYLYLWTLYWFTLKILNIDWNEQQSISWSGSVGASFIPAFASIFILRDFFTESIHKKSITISAQIIILSTLNSFLYESRILQAVCLFVIFILIFANFRFKALTLSLLFIFLSTLPVALNLNRVGIDSVKDITSNWYSNQIRSSFFLVKTRENDSDRERQLQCINSVILQNESLLKFTFGYGQNNHKSVLFDCKEIKNTLRSDLEYVRPVGLTSFAVDFGSVGLILLIGVFLKKIFILYLNRDFISILAMSILPIYLLLTNAWDIIIFNIILLTDFLVRQAKLRSSRDSKIK